MILFKLIELLFHSVNPWFVLENFINSVWFNLWYKSYQCLIYQRRCYFYLINWISNDELIQKNALGFYFHKMFSLKGSVEVTNSGSIVVDSGFVCSVAILWWLCFEKHSPIPHHDSNSQNGLKSSKNLCIDSSIHKVHLLKVLLHS